MMIYGIIGTLVATILILTFVMIRIFLPAKKNNQLLVSELVESKKRPIIIGRMNKFKDSDLDEFLNNEELLDKLISFLEYQIFMKTDSIRSLEKTEQKVGYLDCLHQTHLVFYKLKQKANKDKEKTNKNLV